MRTFLSVVFAILLIAALFVAGSMSFKNRRTFKTQFAIAVAVYVVSVVLRIAGQYDGGIGAGTALQSLYYCGKIFLFDYEFPQVVNAALADNVVYDTAVAAFALSGGFISVFTLSSIVLRGFAGRLKTALYLGREVDVFFGTDDNSLCLAQDLSRKKRLVIMTDQADNKRRALDRGLVFLGSESFFRKKNGTFKYRLLQKELSLFFVSPDDNANISRAFDVLSRIPQSRPHEKSVLNFYINTARKDMKAAFEKYNYSYCNIYFFSESDVVVRRALDACPAYESVEVDTNTACAVAPFEFMVCGNTACGREYFEQLVMGGQFYPELPRAVLTDVDVAATEGLLLAANPETAKCVRVETETCVPGSTAFFDLIKANSNSLNYLVLCYDDQELNLELGKQIAHIYRRAKKTAPRIMAYYRTPDLYGYYRLMPQYEGVTLFGCSDHVYTEAIVVRRELDSAAKQMHCYYEQKKRDNRRAAGADYASVSWEELDMFLQLSNREAIDGIKTKLHLLGLNSFADAKAAFADFEAFVGDRLPALAATEHMRWNAVHFMSGWRTLPLDEAIAAGITKDADKLRHVCLVPYKELDLVQKKLGERYADYDENSVLTIPEIAGKFPALFFNDGIQ